MGIQNVNKYSNILRKVDWERMRKGEKLDSWREMCDQGKGQGILTKFELIKVRGRS